MNKEEILEKSRQENQNQDLAEKEALRDGGNIASVVAWVLATVFFILQIFAGKGMNYALYAIVMSMSATRFIVKAIRLKRKHEIVLAVMYSVFTLMLAAAEVYSLFTASGR